MSIIKTISDRISNETRSKVNSLILDDFYYHTGVNNRIRFVTVESFRGRLVTSDGYYSDSTDLHPMNDLLGQKVTKGSAEGTVVGFMPMTENKMLDGDYIGDGKYKNHKKLVQYNQMVMVFWTRGLLPCWQSVNHLDFL